MVGADHMRKGHLHPSSPQDFVMLQQEIPSGAAGVLVSAYDSVFRTGNRNSAGHLWTSYLTNRSSSKTAEELEELFRNFCGISGSIITPVPHPMSDITMSDGVGLIGNSRWRLTLKDVHGAEHTGFMHYCSGCMAWPCLCDARENVRIDTKTVTVAGNVQKKYKFAVIGNPCRTPGMAGQLQQAIRDPVFREQRVMLQTAAPELTCDGSVLQGASLSDNGHIMLTMFFDDIPGAEAHSEQAFAKMCDSRGQGAGMGPIFRTLAGVNPL